MSNEEIPPWHTLPEEDKTKAKELYAELDELTARYEKLRDDENISPEKN